MNQNVMPRNQYVVTKTGIVIGCAYIQKPYVPMDEHAQLIQNSLINIKEGERDKSFVAYIVIVFMALITALIQIFPQIT